MTLTLNNTNTLTANNIVVNGTDISSLYATKTYVDNEIANINVGSGGGGGITQQDLDDAINPVIAVNDGQNLVITDINNNLANNFQTTTQLNINFYNKTEVDSAIEVVDTKALNNFNSINAINTNLTNNYKNNTQLDNDYYTKAQINSNNWIDNTALAPYATTATLTANYKNNTQLETDYYTKAQIDANNWINNTALAPYATTATLTANYKNNTQLETDYYTKAQIDANNWIDNTALAGYALTSTLTSDYLTSTQIGNSYYNKGEVDGLIAGVSGGGGGVTNPIELVDSNTSIERYTNATKSNISLDLSINETASAIRLINGTNDDTDTNTYIECNNTTNGTTFFKQLFIKGAVSFDNDTIFLPVSSNGIQLWRISNNGDPTLRIRDGTAQWIYVNNNLKCTNANTEDGNIMILNDNSAVNNSNRMRLGSLTSAEVGIGKANESGYFLSVGGATKVDSLEVDNNITMNGDTITSTNNNGVEIFKNTTDASNVLTVKNAQGYIKMHSFNINAYNSSNNSPSLLLLNTIANAGVYCLNLGIGVIAGSNRLSVGGGNTNIGGTSSFQGASTFNNSILVSGGGRIYQQANANNSLNIISLTEQNFSLQSNRNADPSQSDIYINLNTSNGITLNKATVFNDIVNTIGKFTSEGDFDVDIGATGTPEFRVLGSSVNFFEKASITHTQLPGPIDQIFFRNPDTNGQTIIEIGTKNVFEVNDGGIDIIGDISYTGSIGPSSDKRLKEDIKDLKTEKAVELVKNIKPKTYKFINKEKYGDRSCCGFIANEMMEYKGFPKEWSNIVRQGRDGYLKFDYSMTTPLLWSALQYALNEIDKIESEKDDLLDLVKSMKKEMKTMKGEITKIKNKMKGNDKSDSD